MIAELTLMLCKLNYVLPWTMNSQADGKDDAKDPDYFLQWDFIILKVTLPHPHHHPFLR